VGIVIALVVHGAKATLRPVANVATAGLAAPALSTAEDASSLALAVTAIVVPIVAGILLIALVVLIIVLLVRRRRRRAAAKASAAAP